MSSRKCQHCNYPYVTSNHCPNCGSNSPIPDETFGIIGGIIVIGVIIFFVINSGSNSSGGGNIPAPTEVIADSADVVAEDTAAAEENISYTSNKLVSFTNNTGEKIYLAYAFWNATELKWESHGWYSIEIDNSTDITIPSTSPGNKIYYFTQADSGNEKSGEYDFCIDPVDPFTFSQDESICNLHTTKKFIELDLSTEGNTFVNISY